MLNIYSGHLAVWNVQLGNVKICVMCLLQLVLKGSKCHTTRTHEGGIWLARLIGGFIEPGRCQTKAYLRIRVSAGETKYNL